MENIQSYYRELRNKKCPNSLVDKKKLNDNEKYVEQFNRNVSDSSVCDRYVKKDTYPITNDSFDKEMYKKSPIYVKTEDEKTMIAGNVARKADLGNTTHHTMEQVQPVWYKSFEGRLMVRKSIML